MDKLICRICLETSPVMINLLEKEPEQEKTYAEMIKPICSKLISKANGKPVYICGSCLEDAKWAVQVEGQLNATDEKFEKILQNAPNYKPKCQICSKRCNNYNLLRVHLRTHIPHRPYKCTHCPRAFGLVKDQVNHIRTHTGEKPYICSQCSEAFSKKSLLDEHKLTHST